MRTIRLGSSGATALVDDEDYAAVVAAGPWRPQRTGRSTTAYAIRNVATPKGRTTQRLHTFLTGFVQTDHRNHDGLDNRRANLREASCAQNGANKRPQVGKSSVYKGVSWDRRAKKWRAYITVARRRTWLGWHIHEMDAAAAYDDAAAERFGPFAETNGVRGLMSCA